MNVLKEMKESGKLPNFVKLVELVKCEGILSPVENLIFQVFRICPSIWKASLRKEEKE